MMTQKFFMAKKYHTQNQKSNNGLREKLILAQRHDITPNIHEVHKNQLEKSKFNGKNGKEHKQAIQRNEFPKVRIYSSSHMVREM